MANYTPKQIADAIDSMFSDEAPLGLSMFHAGVPASVVDAYVYSHPHLVVLAGKCRSIGDDNSIDVQAHMAFARAALNLGAISYLPADTLLGLGNVAAGRHFLAGFEGGMPSDTPLA